MIDIHTLQLLELLSRTNSPTEQHSLILSFCLYQGDMNTQKDQIEHLLKLYGDRIETKRAEGLKSYAKRKSQAGKNYPKPKFFPDYIGGGTCGGCGAAIGKGPVFRQKIDGQYTNWHSIPSCFPADKRSLMESDRGYMKWCAPIPVQAEETEESELD